MTGAVACRGDDDSTPRHGSDQDVQTERQDSGLEASAPAHDAGPNPSFVTLSDGRIRGSADGGARRFLGIPFAKPPVGDLRWKAPIRNEPWSDTRDATTYSVPCAQPKGLLGGGSTNEDCLYLNVWAPDEASSQPVPVLFWLHGGGNAFGSISDDIPLGVGGKFFDGRTFAATHHVVVVAADYRLGALGFFSHPALRDEGSPPGNQGLLDQQMALRWVHDNIQAFGGDPENVTIFGESAGSADVCLHLAAPDSKGLFHRAISESGGCTMRVESQSEAENQIPAFEQAMGCAGKSNVLDCLRSKSAEELVAAAKVASSEDAGTADAASFKQPFATLFENFANYAGTSPLWQFQVVVDGQFLLDQPRTLFDTGQISKVPYILGSNADEGSLFHLEIPPIQNESEYTAALEARFGPRAGEVLAHYPVADFASANDALIRVTGDSYLVCGTHDSARRAAAAGLDVHMYNFAVPVSAGALMLGATHGAEIAFVFDVLPEPDAQRRAVADAIQGYWSRFGATGDPNGAGAFTWPKFSATMDNRLEFALDPTTSLVDGFRAEECAFWRTFYDAAFE